MKQSFPGDHVVALQFETLRNISTKKDIHQGIKHLVGNIKTLELLKLGQESGDGLLTTNVANKEENVRDATSFLKAKKKSPMISTKSGVPGIMYDSLVNFPDHFHIKNGGIVILCDRSEENKDKSGYLSLINPSIANGGHTHDVIRSFHKEYPNQQDTYCRVEVIYIDKNKEPELRGEVSISRNVQKAVKDLSIAGKRGIFDDLDFLNENSISLTETDKHKFDTLKLLQVSFLLCPDSKWIEWTEKKLSRASIYSSKAKCLKVYRDLTNNNPEAKKFIDNISPEAKKIYTSYQRSDVFKGMLKQIKEDSYTTTNDNKFNLKDGWRLPIISALSYFLNESTFKVKHPSNDILRGIIAFIYESGYQNEKNVQLLGKNASSYSTVLRMLENNADFVSIGKEIFK